MPSLNMQGPHDLNELTIAAKVTSGKVGNYALGYMGSGAKSNTFMVNYVGRSDSDLAKRLNDHVDKQPKFMYSYAPSVDDAFKEECRNYHDFGPPGNDVHPATPSGSSVKCPYCS